MLEYRNSWVINGLADIHDCGPEFVLFLVQGRKNNAERFLMIGTERYLARIILQGYNASPPLISHQNLINL